MKAIVQDKRGKEFSTMKVIEMDSPSPTHGEIKVRMISSRINPVDMDLLKGFPSLKYQKPQIGGIDGAGEVIALGEGVENFRLGQVVFFYRLFSDIGTWAEEITIPSAHAALIPKSITPQSSGAIALPLLTAYEALTALQARQGEKILIHGAGGGVGFQAVQLAKSMGFEVYANASSRDEKELYEAGVTRVIDYKKEDFEKALEQNKMDYVFDVLGKTTLLKSIRMKPKKVVSTSFPDLNKMNKTGVQLPGVLKFIMKLMTSKFRKAASKYQVELIGQVTGANGEHLAQATELINGMEYKTRNQRKISLAEIEKRGLSKKDVGSVIEF